MFSFLRPISLALLAAPLLALAAPPEASTEHVQARLLSSQSTVAPGQRFTVAFEQNIKSHWHTYWQNPGDSGQATTLDWTGAQAGPIQWPTPSVQAIGPIVNYGYEGRAALLMELTVPADAKPGSRFKPTAAVKWLVCKDVCIPEDVSLGLDLPVAAEGKASADAAQIEEWRGAIPKPAAFAVQLKAASQGVRLSGTTAGVTKAYFFADTWGAVAHSAPQAFKAEGGNWTLDIPAGDEPLAAGKPLSGVLVLTTAAGEQASTVSVPMPEGAGKGPGPADLSAPEAGSAGAAAAATPAPESELGLLPALALALVGGLILNLMPCVFPILAMKAAALAASAHDAKRSRRDGLAFLAGVLVTFLILAGVLLALRAAGEAVGWGFQLQSPGVVAALAALFTLIGLNLAGVFEFGRAAPSSVCSAQARHPLANDFLSGVLAVVIASPCSAPFMGASLGFAIGLPAAQALLLFVALGFGLALPYLVAGFVPAVAYLLPKPGPWMGTLRRLLAFPMFATVAWLVWVLGQQSGIDGAGTLLALLVCMAAIVWALTLRGRTRLVIAGVLIAFTAVLTAAIGRNVLQVVEPAKLASAATKDGAGQRWQPWSAERVAQLSDAGRPVFIDFTAAWCVTCQYNKKSTLSDEQVLADFDAKKVAMLRADWTRRDPAITAALTALGRSGVPVYVLQAPGKPPVVLTEILGKDEVRAAIAAL